MNANTTAPRPVVEGHLLRLNERHEIAIYARDGRLWVAEFVEGRGELTDATTWFRFHAKAHTCRRIALRSAVPLSKETLAKIEELHLAMTLSSGATLNSRVRDLLRACQRLVARMGLRAEA